MSQDTQNSVASLVERSPSLTGAEIVATLKPPPQFEEATFDSYRPDSRFSSQTVARDTLKAFLQPPKAMPKNGFFSFGKKKVQQPQDKDLIGPIKQPGIYLDGGFGVGKTHLLAAAWHAANGRKYFGSFLEYTSLVGALGFKQAVDALTGANLICIDEFELDDPGDTMMMTRLISQLTASGTKFIATSNTPPNALGEGRFAAQDFLREIQAMSDSFLTIRIDGEDYRQRDLQRDARVSDEISYRFAIADAVAYGDRATDDEFGKLIKHLGTLHPSNFSRLVQGVKLIGLRNVYELKDQTEALRFVAFIDRVYDSQIQIIATGVALNNIFGGGMLEGGYRKKYLRCISRLNALTNNEF